MTMENQSYYDKDYPDPDPKWELDLDSFEKHIYVANINYFISDWTSEPTFVPTVIVYSVAFLVGLIGNGVVVFALLGDKKAHNVTNSFLVSLAVADMLFLLVCVPYETVLKLSHYLHAGRVFCKLTGIVEMMTAAASIWNLTLVSIERYIVIVHPMRSRTLCTLGRTKKMIILVWVAAAIISLPSGHVMDTKDVLYYNNETYFMDSECGEHNFRLESERIVFAWYQLMVLFLVPTLIMAYCYSVVIRVLWLSTQQLASMTGNAGRKEKCTRYSSIDATQALTTGSPVDSSTPKHHSACVSKTLVVESLNGATNSRPLRVSRLGGATDQSYEMKEARKQVIKMLLTIIVVFIICWGPKLVFKLLKQHEVRALHTQAVFTTMLIIGLLPYVQSATNPLIYSFMSKNFRRSLRSSLHRHCACACANRCMLPRDVSAHARGAGGCGGGQGRALRLRKLHGEPMTSSLYTGGVSSTSGYLSAPTTTALVLD